MTLPCFLAKIVQILQIVIVFFWKGERRKSLDFDIFGQPNGWGFTHYCLSFFIWPSSGGNSLSKLDQKSKFWVRFFLMKIWIIQIFFKQCFCWLECYLWWEFRQYWVIFEGVKTQKLPKRLISWMLNRYGKLWKLLTEQPMQFW